MLEEAADYVLKPDLRLSKGCTTPASGKPQLRGGKPQLLVFDVREGWEPLCAFLDKPVPDRSAFGRLDLFFPFRDGWDSARVHCGADST